MRPLIDRYDIFCIAVAALLAVLISLGGYFFPRDVASKTEVFTYHGQCIEDLAPTFYEVN